MWNSIASVSSSLTLVAFIVAAAVFLYRRKFIQTEKLIRAAPESERPKLIEKVIGDINIDTDGLTKDHRYQLALKQLQAHSRRFQITATVIVVVALLIAVLAAYAVSRSQTHQIESGSPQTTSSSPTPSSSASISVSPSILPARIRPWTRHTLVAVATTSPTPERQLEPTSYPDTEPTIHPDVASRGDVTGFVYDAETDLPILGAVIVAKNDKTNATYQTASRSDGMFSMVVLAGSYSVTVSRNGYINVTEHCKTSYGSQCGVSPRLVKMPK
jgi:carboxypeptidase family protein